MRYLTFILVSLFIYTSVLAAVELDGDDNNAIDVDKGGTNATTAAGARSALGITTLLAGKQNADDDLTTFAGITPSANVISVLSAVDYSAIKALLGLDNIDNTSDADKPVSTATQTALDAKQATLVSGANIKTINSTSILGSGDITISGGTGAVDSVNGETGVVVLDADDIDDTSTTNKFVTATDVTNLGNLSGTNTGDQDLSGYLSKTNTTSYTPSADYHPATKKYVDDTVTGAGGYTDENAQDAWGALLSGGTQTGITVTYDDESGTASYVVDFSGLTSVYEPIKGSDDNYVTDAEKVVIGNTSGTNTGDQDLSDYLLSSTAASTYQPLMGADDNYVTDAEKVIIGNTSGTNTGDQDISGKADVSCFADETAFNACFALTWPTGSMTWPSAAGIMVYGGSSAYGDSLTLDADLSSVSASDDSVPSAKATKTALDLKVDNSFLGTAAQLNVGTSPGNVVQLGGACTVGDGAYTDQTICEANSGEWVGVLSIICDADTEACDTKLDLISAYEVDQRIAAGTGLSHATSDGNYYASKDGAWASLYHVYQEYDSNMITWPSAISATEVGYLDGLTEALSTSLAAKTTTVYSGTIELNTTTVANAGVIASGSSQLLSTAITATGVIAASDGVDWYFVGDPVAKTGFVPGTSGMLTLWPYVSADGYIQVRISNNTAASITLNTAGNGATIKLAVRR